MAAIQDMEVQDYRDVGNRCLVNNCGVAERVDAPTPVTEEQDRLRTWEREPYRDVAHSEVEEIEVPTAGFDSPPPQKTTRMAGCCVFSSYPFMRTLGSL